MVIQINKILATVIAFSDLTNNAITYRGDVIFEGGYTRLEGSKITTFANENNEYNQILAEGEPASYSSTPIDDENLYAVAHRIRYYPLELKMYLYTDASVAKEDKYLTGQYIEYDMQSDDITSRANQDKQGTITIFKDN